MLLCRSPALTPSLSYHTFFGGGNHALPAAATVETQQVCEPRSLLEAPACQARVITCRVVPCRALRWPTESLALALAGEGAEQAARGHSGLLREAQCACARRPSPSTTERATRWPTAHRRNSAHMRLRPPQDGNPLRIGPWQVLWWQPRWYHAERDAFCHQPISTTEVLPCESNCRPAHKTAAHRGRVAASARARAALPHARCANSQTATRRRLPGHAGEWLLLPRSTTNRSSPRHESAGLGPLGLEPGCPGTPARPLPARHDPAPPGRPADGQRSLLAAEAHGQAQQDPLLDNRAHRDPRVGCGNQAGGEPPTPPPCAIGLARAPPTPPLAPLASPRDPQPETAGEGRVADAPPCVLGLAPRALGLARDPQPETAGVGRADALRRAVPVRSS